MNIDEIVKVSASIAEQGVLRREFGIPLLLTRDETMPLGPGRVMTFADHDAMADVFPVASEPYAAGKTHFSKEPSPKNLMIGRVNLDNPAPAILLGGTLAPLASFQAINNGTFGLSVDGGALANVGPLDFTAATSYTDVAGIIDAKLTADAIAADCAFVEPNEGKPGYMKLTGTATGTGKTLGADAPSTGTDISALLGWTLAAGVKEQKGLEKETVESALNALQELDGSFYFVTTDITFTDEEKKAVNDWVASREYMVFLESNDPQVLITNESSSLFYQLSELKPQRTVGTYSATEDYKSLSAAADLGLINFSARNSMRTLKFKTMHGTLPDAINSTQKKELDRKKVNVYTTFSGDDIYTEGYTFKPGVFADVRYFMDWFVNAVRVEKYNLLRQIPVLAQDEDGMTALVDAVSNVCRQAVRNGGIGPGQLSPALTKHLKDTTGNDEFDGFLPNGYLVYSNPISEQPQSDRNERKAPEVFVWLKGSGAIHFANLGALFEN